MGFNVTIEKFDGPLDLMLHLIKEKQMDIFSLDIVELADQYIGYIHDAQKMHLDIASEYLVELAALIEYKSKKLLPHEYDVLDDNYEESQDENLVRRLIEYQKYKEVTEKFNSLYRQRELSFDKPQSAIADNWTNVEQSYSNTTPYDLIKAMNKVLNRLSIAKPYEVSVATQRISVEDKISLLKKEIRENGNRVFTLSESISKCEDVYDVVVSFLALLQMVNEAYLQFSIKNEEVYFSRGICDE